MTELTDPPLPQIDMRAFWTDLLEVAELTADKLSPSSCVTVHDDFEDGRTAEVELYFNIDPQTVLDLWRKHQIDAGEVVR